MTREQFIQFVTTHTRTYAKLFKYEKYREYVSFMHSWCDLLENDYFTDKTRIQWILNDMHAHPRCKLCNKEIVKNAYNMFHSPFDWCNECRRKDPEIQKKH